MSESYDQNKLKEEKYQNMLKIIRKNNGKILLNDPDKLECVGVIISSCTFSGVTTYGGPVILCTNYNIGSIILSEDQFDTMVEFVKERLKEGDKKNE